MGWTPGCALKGRSQDSARGKCNLPAPTLSTDPRPRSDGIQFQSTGSVIGRCRSGAVQVIFLWPSLIGILTTVLSLVVQTTHPPTWSPWSVTLQLHSPWHMGENPSLLMEICPPPHPPSSCTERKKGIFNNMAIYSCKHMAERSREQKENYFSQLMLPRIANGLAINTTLQCPW